MPPDHSISLRAKRAADRLITEPGRRARAADGGATRTRSPTSSTTSSACTHRIWEEKAIGYLYEHYAANARVFQDDGIVYGRERVIADTTQTIGAFPDLKLHADDIVWCGDEDTGFWTSHRLTLVGHNTGWSVWGPPTGRRIVARRDRGLLLAREPDPRGVRDLQHRRASCASSATTRARSPRRTALPRRPARRRGRAPGRPGRARAAARRRARHRGLRAADAARALELAAARPHRDAATRPACASTGRPTASSSAAATTRRTC